MTAAWAPVAVAVVVLLFILGGIYEELKTIRGLLERAAVIDKNDPRA